LGYGDSSDGTGELLFDKFAFEIGALLIECNHGGPEFGPIVDSTRFAQLSFVANRIWRCIPLDTDVFCSIESDLIWDAKTILKLIDHVSEYPVIAPLVFHREPAGASFVRFYDTFAFRINGERFTNEPPYHPSLNGSVMRLDSAGSCLVMQGSIARQITVPEEDVIVGTCKQIYSLGYAVHCDPQLRVEHP
jgi:hypothetical protein